MAAWRSPAAGAPRSSWSASSSSGSRSSRGWLEPRIAFFPFAGEDETPRTFGLAFEPLTIDTADGERLRAWRIDVTGAARADPVFPRQRRKPLELGADPRGDRAPRLLHRRDRLSRVLV
jgi:hypothetical protein